MLYGLNRNKTWKLCTVYSDCFRALTESKTVCFIWWCQSILWFLVIHINPACFWRYSLCLLCLTCVGPQTLEHSIYNVYSRGWGTDGCGRWSRSTESQHSSHIYSCGAWCLFHRENNLLPEVPRARQQAGQQNHWNMPFGNCRHISIQAVFFHLRKKWRKWFLDFSQLPMGCWQPSQHRWMDFGKLE